jgi:4-amino-4-deoxychorismate lyase
VHALINGNYSSCVAVNNRGLAYGDGLFETIVFANGHLQFLQRHLDRLQQGCKKLKIDCCMHSVKTDIDKLLRATHLSSGVLKIIITRQSSKRGYRGDFNSGCSRIVYLDEHSADITLSGEQGVKLRICDIRLSVNPQLAGIKHLSRLENVLAASEWNNSDIAEGLMLDVDGRLVEGTMSNIFLVRGSKLLTPALHRCGVEGVVRQLLLDKILPQLALNCSITDLTVSDLLAADEMFICNSVIGIWPVVAIGCHHKLVGTVTRNIQQVFCAENKT